jgi:diacylglycerol kinase (ATP)
VRIALTANPRSGGGLDPEPLADAMRARGAEVQLFGPEEDELRRLEAAAPDRIAVAGGEGSIAPAADSARRLRVPLAVIPAGTANDFARTNGLPEDVREAAELAASGTALRALDLAHLADGYPLAYALGALRAAATEAPLRCTVRVDGREVFAGGAWHVIVAVTGAFGGGSELGAADPGDGELDVAVLTAGSRLALARRAWGLRRGTIAEQKPVEHHRGQRIEVGLPPGTELNVDGELRDGGMERVTAAPAAYTLVVPGA